jgi:3-hydroxyacyl-[acyl-carrier-protein] dehydratase
MLDVTQIQKILPHRYPFLLVDRVTEVTETEIRAYKNVTIAEPVFQGHFPDHPIYPGVMIVEGMAQAGACFAFGADESKQAEIADKVFYFTGIDKAKFKRPVKPGDKLEYVIKLKKNRGPMWVFEGEAYVDGELASSAELKAMVVDK